MTDDLSFRRMGRPSACGSCGECDRCKRAAYMRTYYQKKSPEERYRIFVAGRDPERIAKAKKVYSRSQGCRDTIKRSILRNPDRNRARVHVRNAVVRGKLLRGPCFCGVIKSEAHHADYTKPLEVEWLCRRHHIERHSRGKHA